MTRFLRTLSALLIVAVVAASGAACRKESEALYADPLINVFTERARDEGLTREQTDGKRLFARYCATCHGDAGQGDGQNAYNLDPEPPDFSESLKLHQPSYWRRIIEGGSAAVGRSPQCPPWGRMLASSDLDALVGYLQVLTNPSAR
ncbi:MAG: cytochrome c [Acidobacteria bacterium]|nr:cytochrome c [Acidobacteriota bacterium]